LVIPSINCSDFAAAASQIKKSEEFSEWIHIDVSDGKFTDVKSWGNPDELKSINTKQNIEVHLMVENPDEKALLWLEAGVKRIIVHVQTIRDPRSLMSLADNYSAEIMLALDPSQSIENTHPYLKEFKLLQVLTVFPGLSGQREQSGWAEKIKSLRELSPTATIEVDGGMDPMDARIAKDAGADIIVSGSYIFSSPDPKGAYEKLDSI